MFEQKGSTFKVVVPDITPDVPDAKDAADVPDATKFPDDPEAALR